MAGIRVEGNTSGNVAEVDVNNNFKVNLPTTQSQAGFASAQFEVDSGSIIGSRLIRIPRVSIDQRLKVGVDGIQALYNFTATAQNTADFKHAFTTMTMTQSAGFLNINPALATVSGNFAYLQTWRHFSLQGDCSLDSEAVMIVNAANPANQILELGFFLGTAAGTVPTDGAFFRVTSAGVVGVVSSNSVETLTSVFLGAIPINVAAKFKVIVHQRKTTFWINDILYGNIDTPAGNTTPFLSQSLPWCQMMRNTGTVVGGTTAKIGSINVRMADVGAGKPWSHQMATQGNAYQGQEGDIMGSLAIYSNAALGAAAALTNTTSAAPNTGLGGAVLVLPTLAAGTDGILFSYQNPVGSVSQPPKTLVVTGVHISSGVQVALTGAPLNLIYGIAYGSTALSLATAETGSFVTATTKAPRRVLLGAQNYVVTAAAGVGAADIVRQFTSPIVVNPGEFFIITMRNVGTVTSAGALAITAAVDHYFE